MADGKSTGSVVVAGEVSARDSRVVDISDLLEFQKHQMEQLRLALREELRAGPPPSKRVFELSADWLPRKLKGMVSDKSFEGRVRNHLLPALGHHTSATLKPKHIEEMMDRLLEDKDLSEQTVNHVRNAGLQLIADAIRNEEWRAPNPFAAVDPLALPDRDYDVFTKPEAADLLRSVVYQWRNVFATAIYLGPRRGEIFALRRAWLDLKNKLVSFNGSHERDTTKNGKRRKNIPVPEELVPYLEDALERAGRSEFVFPSADGGRLTRDTKLVDVLKDAMTTAELLEAETGEPRPITFHGLRRVSSCLHQEAGCHPWIVSKVLGHSQATLLLMGSPGENMTARRYTQFSQTYIREQLNKLSLKSQSHP